VVDHRDAVAGQAHVQLDSIGTQRECCPEGGERILGSVLGCATVGDYLERHLHLTTLNTGRCCASIDGGSNRSATDMRLPASHIAPRTTRVARSVLCVPHFRSGVPTRCRFRQRVDRQSNWGRPNHSTTTQGRHRLGNKPLSGQHESSRAAGGYGHGAKLAQGLDNAAALTT
jgi:hypothetical protein